MLLHSVAMTHSQRGRNSHTGEGDVPPRQRDKRITASQKKSNRNRYEKEQQRVKQHSNNRLKLLGKPRRELVMLERNHSRQHVHAATVIKHLLFNHVYKLQQQSTMLSNIDNERVLCVLPRLH